MDLRVSIEPQQGASYEAVVQLAHAVEDAGFDGLFLADHYLRIPHVSASDGLPGPLDAWITLAALAVETRRLTLGTLMTAVTFRDPAVLASLVSQVMEMSGGRLEVGLGLGWYEAEHRAYGIPFPDLSERYRKYEAQIEILAALPRPPWLILGGRGERRTPRLAALYADEFNVPSLTIEETASRLATALDEREKRRPAAPGLLLSNVLLICAGRSDAEVRRRLAKIGRDRADLAGKSLIGTPEEIVDLIGRFASIGVRRMYLKFLDLTDLDQIELIATEILDQF